MIWPGINSESRQLNAPGGDWGVFTRLIVYSGLIWLTAIALVNLKVWAMTGSSYVLFVFLFSVCSLASVGSVHLLLESRRPEASAARLEFCLLAILLVLVLLLHFNLTVILLPVFAAALLGLLGAKQFGWLDLETRSLVFLAVVFTTAGVSLYDDDVLSRLTKFIVTHNFGVFSWIGALLTVPFLLLLLRAPATKTAPCGVAAFLGKCLYFGLISVLLLNIARGEPYHCGAYTGPANAVFHGKIPLLEVNAQYGLNYLVFTTAFLAAGAARMETAWLVTGILNSLMIFYFGFLLDKVIKNKRALHLLYAAATLVYIACNTFQATDHIIVVSTVLTPSTGAIRFFPSLLLALALMEIPPGKYISAAALLAFGLNILWSPESSIWAAAIVGAWIAVRCLYDSLIGFRAALLGALAYFAASLAAFGGFFLAYGIPWSIANISTGYLIFATYLNGETSWHSAIDSTDLIWVGTGAFYFLAVGVVMQTALFARKNQTAQKNEIVTLLTPLTLLGLAQSTYYVGHPLKGCLATALLPMLAIFLFFACKGRFEGAGWPPELRLLSTLGLATLALFGFFYGAFSLTQNDASIGHHLVAGGPDGTLAAIRDLTSPTLDRMIETVSSQAVSSSKYTPVRLRELISLLDTHEPSARATVFSPEAGLALDWSDKTNALPIGNRDNDELSRALQTKIVAAADNLPEHSQLFIAKDPTDLSQMEHFLLQRLRKNHSFEKVYSGDMVDIYQLAPRSARNDLGVPLITHGATPELEAALDFNPVTWYTSPTSANSFTQSLGFIFEHPEVVQDIQLFGRPNFPEYTPDIVKITVVTAANDRVELDPSAYTMQEATNAELNTLVKNFRFDYPDPVKEVILTLRAPKITATQYVFFIDEIEFY